MHQQHSRYTYRTTSNLSSARRRLSIIYSLASIGGPRWLYGSISLILGGILSFHVRRWR